MNWVAHEVQYHERALLVVPIWGAVKAWLDGEHDWVPGRLHYTVHRDTDDIHLVSVRFRKYQLIYQTIEGNQVLLIYWVSDTKVLERWRRLAVDFLTRVNYRLKVGNFELNMRDGEVRYKVSVDLEGGQLSSEMVESMTQHGCAAMDLLVPELIAEIRAGGGIPGEAAVRPATSVSPGKRPQKRPPPHRGQA